MGFSEQPERYKKAYNGDISSRSAIKNIAKGILFKEGIDISLINIKEEGVSIEAFAKLVDQIYLAGYKDGFARWKESQHENYDIEKLGARLIGHASKAKTIAAQNQGNKNLSL